MYGIYNHKSFVLNCMQLTCSYAKNLRADSGAILTTLTPFPLQSDLTPPSWSMWRKHEARVNFWCCIEDTCGANRGERRSRKEVEGRGKGRMERKEQEQEGEGGGGGEGRGGGKWGRKEWDEGEKADWEEGEFQQQFLELTHFRIHSAHYS